MVSVIAATAGFIREYFNKIYLLLFKLKIVIHSVFNHAKPTTVIALDGNFLHHRYP